MAGPKMGITRSDGNRRQMACTVLYETIEEKIKYRMKKD